MTKTTLPPAAKRGDAQRLEEDALELHLAVSDLVRVYQFRDRDKICCHDVSVTQCYAMEILLQQGPLQLNELAKRMFLDKSTTSRVIDALERKKYVERVPDSTDGRAVALRITRAGSALNSRIHRDLVDQQKALLRDLDPALRATVADVIKKLAVAAEARFRAGTSCGDATQCCPAPARAPKQ